MNKSDKKFLYPYWELEDYMLGMYDKVNLCLEQYLIEKSIKLLSDNDEFFKIGLCVLEVFQKSSNFHLCNLSLNRRAWIGQSSCFLKYHVPEYLTRKAWVSLDRTQQIKANLTADRIIKIYETKDKKISNQMGISL